jgi:hypothetical protein
MNIRVVLFEKPILLSGRQSFKDNTIVIKSKTIRIDFGYPFIVNGKLCTGYDPPPCQLVQEFKSNTGFSRADLARLVVKTYRSLFKRRGLEAFHAPEDLEISALEKRAREGVWRLQVSS